VGAAGETPTMGVVVAVPDRRPLDLPPRSLGLCRRPGRRRQLGRRPIPLSARIVRSPSLSDGRPGLALAGQRRREPAPSGTYRKLRMAAAPPRGDTPTRHVPSRPLVRDGRQRSAPPVRVTEGSVASRYPPCSARRRPHADRGAPGLHSCAAATTARRVDSLAQPPLLRRGPEPSAQRAHQPAPQPLPLQDEKKGWLSGWAGGSTGALTGEPIDVADQKMG
jgi:hypothetical protein